MTQPVRVVRGKVVAAASPLRDEAAGHSTAIFDPEDVNTPESRAKLADWHADMFVVADYGQILSAETLALAPRGAINLHGSLLPKYRGAAPINWALYRGETETGVSTIHMTPRVDAGPVLAQARTPIDPDENAVELETRLAALGAPLVVETIAALEAGKAAAISQDLSLATKARRLRKTDGAIDWSRTALEIKNQVRALQPWPRAYTDWLRTGGPPMRLIVGRVDVRDSTHEIAPGTVISANKQELIVAAGEGAVSLVQVQSAGRQMMAVADFLRGHSVRPGEVFGPARASPAAK